MSTRQWANIGEDAGALHALVEQVAGHVPVAIIDHLWIFPPRRIAVGESVVIVVGALDEADRRRVITGRFTITRNRRGEASVKVRYDEHGTAPVDALARIVQGVLRRLGEDAEAEPQEVAIAGRQQRWDELVVELGGRPRSPAEPPADAPADAPGDASADAPADAPTVAPPTVNETGEAPNRDEPQDSGDR
jgi:hypothetical protein